MRGTVLIVSKEPRLLETRDSLLRRAGCKTLLTDCLEEAVRIIEREKPDLIILCQSIGIAVQRRVSQELQREHASIRILCL